MIQKQAAIILNHYIDIGESKYIEFQDIIVLVKNISIVTALIIIKEG